MKNHEEIRAERRAYYEAKRSRQEETRKEVLDLRERGYSRKDIAEKVGLSESTVRLIK